MTAMSQTARSVERALALLAEVVGLPPSTALRLLRTLEAAGFVRRGSDGWFRAGTRLIQLGAAAFGRQELVRLGEPALQRLVEATGESAYLSIAGPGDTAIYVAMVEGTHPVRHTSWVGRAVPMAGLAVGRALRGPVPPEGYVAERDGSDPDVTAIAAPVLRPGGVAGALSVIGPTYRIDDATMHAYGAAVRAEAGALSATFGLSTPKAVGS
jgi:urocanate hydratase